MVFVNSDRYTGDIIVKYPDNVVLHTLDEKFIPSTIARKSDIENFESNVQPDWNQNDETAPDYIKNKTHYENIVYNT
jgi:hypothetical protein